MNEETREEIDTLEEEIEKLLSGLAQERAKSAEWRTYIKWQLDSLSTKLQKLENRIEATTESLGVA